MYKRNVQLCFENLQHEVNLERILEIENFRNIPVCYDLGHVNIRKSPIECIDNKNIRYFYIHDIHRLPFLGAIDWTDRAEIKLSRDTPPKKKILEVHGNITNHKCAEEYNIYLWQKAAISIQ